MSAIPGVPVAPLYGALYFAAVISTALYGVTCMQTFFYYVHYRDEPLRTKSFVAALWALSTIHHALIISGTYKYVMAGMVDPASFTDTIPELVILLTVLVALLTQGFFVYRIYIFSGKNIVGPVLWLPIAIFQLVSALIYVGKALYYSADDVHVVELAVLNDTLLVGMISSCIFADAGVDVLIAIFLTCLLVCQRSGTPVLKSTVHLLQRLIMLAVNSGIWTATFAVLSAILFLVFPSNMLYYVFGIPLCAIYCNTLLANLNSRMYILGETIIDDVGMDIWTRSRASDGARGNDQRGELGLIPPPCQVDFPQLERQKRYYQGSRGSNGIIGMDGIVSSL